MFKTGVDIIEQIDNYTDDKKVKDLILKIVEFYEKKLQKLQYKIKHEKNKIKKIQNENKENLNFLKIENHEKIKTMINYVTEKDVAKIKKLSIENYNCKIENEKELNLIQNLNQNLDKTFVIMKKQIEEIQILQKENQKLKRQNNLLYDQNVKNKLLLKKNIENFETKSHFIKPDFSRTEVKASNYEALGNTKKLMQKKKRNLSLEKPKMKKLIKKEALFESFINSKLAHDKYNKNINLSLDNPFLYMKKKKSHLNKNKVDIHEMKKYLEFLEKKERRILNRVLRFPVSSVYSVKQKKIHLEKELVKLDEEIEYVKKVIKYHEN